MQRLTVPFIIVGSIVTLALIGGGLAGSNQPTKKLTPSEVLAPYVTDEAIPAVDVLNADNKKTPLAGLAPSGKITLVTLWSSVCNECQTELPIVDTFARNHADAFNVVLINESDQPNPAAAALRSYGVELPTHFDNGGAVYNALSATMPANYVIKNQRIIYYFPGRIDQTHLDALLTQI